MPLLDPFCSFQFPDADAHFDGFTTDAIYLID